MQQARTDSDPEVQSPELQENRSVVQTVRSCSALKREGSTEIPYKPDSSTPDDIVTLEVSNSGKMIVKSQVVDYQYRGTELGGYNLLDFFVDTYEAEITKADCEAEAFDEEVHRGPGRPRHPRIRYLNDHPKSGTVHRIIRAHGHRNLPNFLGRWLPRNDDKKSYDFYCACMLMLLKPWRKLQTDLKSPSESWAGAFETFRASAAPRARRALSGIQYFHECESAANVDDSGPYPNQPAPDAQILDDEAGTDHIPRSQEFSEEGLALLKAENTPLREQIHGHMAIEVAKLVGVFPNRQDDWPVDSTDSPSNATENDLGRVAAWSKLLQDAVDQKNDMRNVPPASEIADVPTVQRSTLDSTMSTTQAMVLLQPADSEQALPAVNPGSLKPDQLRAYDIINWHLAKTLQGADVPPLHMVLYGEGGTGKSRVIQTITESFSACGAAHMLMKAAYTGVAASLVNGKTTHVIPCLSLASKSSVTDASKKKLQDFWRNIRYLIIDEYSMLSKSFLATLSRNIAIGMDGWLGFRPGQSFGGLNVIASIPACRLREEGGVVLSNRHKGHRGLADRSAYLRGVHHRRHPQRADARYRSDLEGLPRPSP